MKDYLKLLDYIPHPLLDMTPTEVMGAIFKQINEANPSLVIGEHAMPGSMVWEGKVVPEWLPHDTVVRLDYEVPAVVRPSVRLGSKQHTAKIYFDNPKDFDQFKELTGFMHPTSVHIPHAEWLKSKRPDDVVNLHDGLQASPYTLTKEDFDKHSYVIFRYLLSDK